MDYSNDLVGNPDLMLELLAVLTRRAGGEIRFGPDDRMESFNLRGALLEDDEGRKYLRLNFHEETVGHA